MNDQPDNSPGFDNRLLIIPAALLLALGLGLFLMWRPVRPPVAPAPPLELARTNLVRWQNRWCQPGGTNLFTGVLVEAYPGGQPMSRSMVSNGLLNGLSVGWFTNGQMQVREFYQSNLSDGLRTRWYPNGHKLSEATIVQGKIEGIFRRWHIDGSLAEEIPMRDGRQEGVGRAYYASGFLQEQVEVHDGRTVDKKTWPDGERKSP